VDKIKPLFSLSMKFSNQSISVGLYYIAP